MVSLLIVLASLYVAIIIIYYCCLGPRRSESAGFPARRAGEGLRCRRR